MYGQGTGANGHPSSVRRRSSVAAISPTQPSSIPPKLREGVGLGFTEPSSHLKYKQPVYKSNKHLQRTAGYFLRILRSPRGLITLASVGLLWLLVSYVHTYSGELKTRPVPQAILPLIREGGKVVHRVSPHYAQRLKSWHDYQVQSNPNRPLTPEEIERRSRHTFHPNGLLLVNHRGRHPIQVLIEQAEERWRKKCARQSRTLTDAVREYKQRYRRNPPKGFDDWSVFHMFDLTISHAWLTPLACRWKFAEEHNVQLRDEYDQVMYDMAPHWAL